MGHRTEPLQKTEHPRIDLGLEPLIEPVIKRLLGLKSAERIYFNLRASLGRGVSSQAFCKSALTHLGVSFDLPHKKIRSLRRIEGPVVFVANHPLGAIDALLMIALMGEIRSDFKFMGNSILRGLPELSSALLPVHVMGKKPNVRNNVPVMRKALRYLREGGMVGIFPAGEVAAFNSWTSRKIVESGWNTNVGRLVKNSNATVIPLFFEGRNSLLFQYVGLGVPGLRVALLAQEMLKYRAPVHFKIGDPVRPSELDSFVDTESLTLHLRKRVFTLASDKEREQ